MESIIRNSNNSCCLPFNIRWDKKETNKRSMQEVLDFFKKKEEEVKDKYETSGFGEIKKR